MMSEDDPFFGSGDSDRTILRPTPGGKRGPATPAPGPAAPPQQPYAQPQQPAYGQPAQPQPPGALPDLSGGLNPLSAAATTLLALIAQLRDSASHPDPQALFQHVSQEIQQFEQELEGELTKIKSTVVSRRTCAEVGDKLGLVQKQGKQVRKTGTTSKYQAAKAQKSASKTQASAKGSGAVSPKARRSRSSGTSPACTNR